MLPRALRRWPREYWYGLQTIEAAANGLLLMLPAHARIVINELRLPKWVRGSRGLRHQGPSARGGPLLLLRRGAEAFSKGICARSHGL